MQQLGRRAERDMMASVLDQLRTVDGRTAACTAAALGICCARMMLSSATPEPAAPEGKSWGGFRELLADHRTFVGQWPKIFDGYVGPNRLEPGLIEAAMVTVNSVNACSF
jgi:hypothetical protein